MLLVSKVDRKLTKMLKKLEVDYGDEETWNNIEQGGQGPLLITQGQGEDEKVVMEANVSSTYTS